MRSSRRLVCLLSVVVALSAIAQADGGRARVSGHVYDASGRPLAHAQISVFPLETAFSGGLPATFTNDLGFYTLDTPAYGKTRILVIKEEAGYPNTMSAVFAPEVEALPEVNLDRSADLHDIDIHLGNPDGSIDGEIRDAISKAPVLTARITLRRVSDPDVMLSTNSDRDGTFRFVLPERPIRLTVAAPGYLPWTYVDAATGNNSLELKPHERKRIVVELQPVTK